MERLQSYLSLLQHWNKRINLIGRGNDDDPWNRHIIDSAQLMNYWHEAESWIDLGSGGGLPGLVCAIIAKESHPELRFTLVESDQRKSIFLSQAAHHLDLKIDVRRTRIDSMPVEQFDVISARALAPLSKLLGYSEKFVHPGSILVFLKGQQACHELTQASEDWHIDAETFSSLSDPTGKVFRITKLQRRI